MQYQKIINLLDNTPNQTCKFRTKYWVQINDDSRETCDTNSQIKFKTLILKPCLCDYSDAYALVKKVTGARVDVSARQTNERNKHVIFKYYTPFTECISKVNSG